MQHNLKKSEQKEPLDIATACKITGLGYPTFYKYFRQERLPHERFGRTILFTNNDIVNFMKRHKKGNWKHVNNEFDVLLDVKCDLKELSRQSGLKYSTLTAKIHQVDLPRFQYGTKIVIPQSEFTRYRKTQQTSEWKRYERL